MGAVSQAVDSISQLEFLKACGAQAKTLWKPSPVENANFMNHTCHHKVSSVAPSEKICTEICPHTEDHQAHAPGPREDGELTDPCGIFLENSGKYKWRSGLDLNLRDNRACFSLPARMCLEKEPSRGEMHPFPAAYPLRSLLCPYVSGGSR